MRASREIATIAATVLLAVFASGPLALAGDAPQPFPGERAPPPEPPRPPGPGFELVERAGDARHVVPPNGLVRVRDGTVAYVHTRGPPAEAVVLLVEGATVVHALSGVVDPDAPWRIPLADLVAEAGPIDTLLLKVRSGGHEVRLAYAVSA